MSNGMFPPGAGPERMGDGGYHRDRKPSKWETDYTGADWRFIILCVLALVAGCVVVACVVALMVAVV